MKMTLSALQYLVNNLVEEAEKNDKDPDKIEIRAAFQPSYPLQGIIAGIATPEDIWEDYKEQRLEKGRPLDAEEEAEGDKDDDNTMFIVIEQASDHPYAPRGCWNVARTE